MSSLLCMLQVVNGGDCARTQRAVRWLRRLIHPETSTRSVRSGDGRLHPMQPVQLAQAGNGLQCTG